MRRGFESAEIGHRVEQHLRSAAAGAAGTAGARAPRPRQPDCRRRCPHPRRCGARRFPSSPRWPRPTPSPHANLPPPPGTCVRARAGNPPRSPRRPILWPVRGTPRHAYPDCRTRSRRRENRAARDAARSVRSHRCAQADRRPARQSTDPPRGPARRARPRASSSVRGGWRGLPPRSCCRAAARLARPSFPAKCALADAAVHFE